MANFHVVSNVRKIAALDQQFTRNLEKFLPHSETRVIGYPSNHFTATVRFERARGSNVRGWSHIRSTDGKFLNFFTVGAPGTSDSLSITVQVCFPAEKYNRRLAGVFLVDDDGHTYVAHRGRLSKGKASLCISDVLSQFGNQVVQAFDGKRTTSLILIARLDDSDLANRVFEFAVQARQVASKLAAIRELATDRPKSESEASEKLREYFDEYSGEFTVSDRGTRRVKVIHGEVVAELNSLLRQRGSTQKSQAIDLALVTDKEVKLFEVKTSARTTDVYTAVGQLLIHGACISELLKLPVYRFLVLPARPKEKHEPHIVNHGKMKVIIYQKVGSTYRFEGLQAGD